MTSTKNCPYFIGFEDEMIPGNLEIAQLNPDELNEICNFIDNTKLYEGTQIKTLRQNLADCLLQECTLYDLKMCYDIVVRNATTTTNNNYNATVVASKLYHAIQHSTNVAKLLKLNKNSRFVF